MSRYKKRQHTESAALDLQQAARLCGGRYAYKELVDA